MKPSRLLVKDMFLYGLMSGISKSVGLLLLPLLTRYFSADEYGTIDIIFTFSGLAGLFMTLSLESAVMRLWYESEARGGKNKLVSSALAFVSGFGVLILLIICFISNWISDLLLKDPDSGYFVILGAMSALFQALNSIPSVALRMQRKIIAYNLINLFQSVSYILLTILAIGFYKMHLTAVFTALLFSHVAAFIAMLYVNRKLLTIKFSWKFVVPALQYSFPLFPAVFVTWLNNQSDRLILLFFLGLGAVGVFGASAKLAGIMVLFITIFRQSWSPLAIELLKVDIKVRNEFYVKILNRYILGMFSLASLLLIASKPLMTLLVPEQYLEGYVVIPWLLGAAIFHGAASITNVGTIITKKTIANSIAAWTGALVNVILSIFLIPKFGISGAAIGTFIAEMILMAILWWFTYKLAGLKFNRSLVVGVTAVYIVASYLYTSY